MKNNSVYELESVYGKNKKSYYGKAQVIVSDNGGMFLQSYDTIVCGIVNVEIQKYWNDYSVTTMQHINDFLRQHNKAGYSKKEWLALPWEKAPISSVHSDFKVSLAWV